MLILKLLKTVIGIVVVLAVVCAAWVVVSVTGMFNLPALPFQTTTIDRTGPSVLKSLTDLSDYHAASGHYETVVDLENDTSFIPSWVSGERILYVGKGDVDALVDFSGLGPDAVAVSSDRLSVSLTLPAPTLADPVLDVEDSYVADDDKGVATAFSGSDLEHEAQVKAIDQMAEAAAAEDSLTDLAETNTTDMLTGLLEALGFTDVTVTYE
ncbi:DUF4230 domain-containing protein [Nocardioides sp. GY 10127]|uniref:DUF4230 domain-containing protein n=1 Tax=Nocardioides sp. GY 10127 TaxID=2569762 RepID=UPI0010A7F8F8|nr:DUF4230 domain-containing protein [Nocardioides sp. GY 10127]TIC84428.1 DUF4230 domain-containing protein [Nocardioides sp. GY 10127]